MTLAELQDHLVREIRALLLAERRFVRALPRLADAARDEELRAAFEQDIACTQQHVEWLTQILDELGAGDSEVEPRGSAPPVQGGSAARRRAAGSPAADAALIEAAAELLRAGPAEEEADEVRSLAGGIASIEPHGGVTRRPAWSPPN